MLRRFNSIVAPLSLVGTLVVGTAPSASAQTLLYLRFENNYLDSSGNGYAATPNGTHSFVTDVASNAPGNYSVTNPVGTSISVPRLTGPANNFTMELFLRSTQTTGVGFLAGTFDHTNGDGDSTGGWNIYLSNGRLAFDTGVQGVQSGGQSTIITSSSLADGNWHHIAATLSSTNMMGLYADGVLVNQIQGQLPAAARNNLLFGNSYSPTNFTYSGSLDEIRFTQGVLAPSQFLSNSAAAPEPASLVLVALGLVSTVALKRRGLRM